MFKTKSISTKLILTSITAIMTVSLLNTQTAFGYTTPSENSDHVAAVVPRPGNEVRPAPTPRPPGPVWKISKGGATQFHVWEPLWMWSV